jgi:hypothetical protein
MELASDEDDPALRTLTPSLEEFWIQGKAIRHHTRRGRASNDDQCWKSFIGGAVRLFSMVRHATPHSGTVFGRQCVTEVIHESDVNIHSRDDVWLGIDHVTTGSLPDHEWNVLIIYD